MERLLILVVVIVIWAISAWAKQKSESRERERRQGSGTSPQPPRSGLDEIRRFLQEISQPPREEPPTTTTTSEAPSRARPTPPRAPGRPPTRRPTAARPQPAGRPPRSRPAPTPVAARPPTARRPGRPAPPRRGPARVTTVTEGRVRERLRVEEVRSEAEAVARKAREELVSVRPTELVSVRSAIKAEEYPGAVKAERRDLNEVIRALKHPLARAIVYYEVIGPSLALRTPERILADYG